MQRAFIWGIIRPSTFIGSDFIAKYVWLENCYSTKITLKGRGRNKDIWSVVKCNIIVELFNFLGSNSSELQVLIGCREESGWNIYKVSQHIYLRNFEGKISKHAKVDVGV